jgi:NAD(P)-dependent dehydrogenase (short-subunit alcohol dehydrogenase family)
MEFSGKIAIVTGASSGIGRATAIALARQGASVALVGRNERALRQTVIECDSERVLTVTADVTKNEDLPRIISETIERFGGIDILVNAAGILSSGTIETTTEAQWDEMMTLNVRSVFRLMQLATPALIKHKGNVVNVSSVTGLRAFPGVLAYCVSKAAVDQLTRCSALELASKGVRVNAVNPGVVLSNIHRRGGMDDESYSKFLDHSKTTHPIGRVGQTEEVAELILFLASDKAGWITGATYSIDGGRALTCAR